MKNFVIAMVVCLFGTSFRAQASEPKYEWVNYTAGKKSFPALIFKPSGSGPFPVIAWNHGHAKNLQLAGGAAEYFDLARLFTANGYVLFVPDRHMHEVTENDSSPSLLDQKAGQSERTEKIQRYQKYLQVNAMDVLESLKWLRQQPFVDGNRIVLSGWASGGIAGLMAAERDVKVRAAILFSPGCTQWDNDNGLRDIFRQSLDH